MVRTRTRRAGACRLPLALVAAALALVAVAPAEATISTVGPDGNLWAATPAAVQRATPSGETTDFPLPADAVPDAIAAGPGQRLSLVTHDTTSTPAFSLRTIATDGTWDARVIGLPQQVFDPLDSARGLTVDTAGTTWFAQGWGACLAGTSGTIAKVSADGTVTSLPTPLTSGSDQAYATGNIVADGSGRVWVSGLIPSQVECGASRGWGGSPAIGYVMPNEQLRTTIWCVPDVVVASDGAAWCTSMNGTLRWTADDGFRAYALPAEWTPPLGAWSGGGSRTLGAGPDGTVWYTHQGWANGTSAGPLELASLSPAGEVRAHPDVMSRLLVGEDNGRGAPPMYDWRFAPGGALWILDAGTSNPEPLIATLPAVSAGILVGMAKTTDHGPWGAPIEPDGGPMTVPAPPPVTKPVRLAVSLKAPARLRARTLRRTRSITATATVTRPATVRLRVSVTDRTARKLGLRGRRSRSHDRLTLATAHRSGVASSARTKLTFTRGVASKVTRAPGAVALRLEATATATDRTNATTRTTVTVR